MGLDRGGGRNISTKRTKEEGKTGLSGPKTKRKGNWLTERPAKQIAVGAGSIGAGATLTAALVKNIDFKAWDILLREAFSTLMVQNGPLPVILFAIIMLIGYAFYRTMMNLVKAKDDEIRRLVSARDQLESRLGSQHPASGWQSGGK